MFQYDDYKLTNLLYLLCSFVIHNFIYAFGGTEEINQFGNGLYVWKNDGDRLSRDRSSEKKKNFFLKFKLFGSLSNICEYLWWYVSSWGNLILQFVIKSSINWINVLHEVVSNENSYEFWIENIYQKFKFQVKFGKIESILKFIKIYWK